MAKDKNWDNGDIINIDMTTGVGTTLGPSLFAEVTSLSVNQSNNILYGLVRGVNSEIVRVNADQGDSYTLLTVAIPILSGIAFDTSGTLYASHTNGEIYSIDLTTGSFALETTTSIELNAIAFHPETNVLWAAITKGFGAGKDSLYTVDLTTGDVTPVGVTGFNIVTNDLAFDGDNKLYGVTGTSNQEGKIFEINQVDGSGTLIGTGIGFNHTVGLAYSVNGPIVSVDDVDAIPKEYALKQNYPNPFNPITKIEFSLPVASDVELVVYNILGQQIATLINEQRNAGNHSVIWDATDSFGKKLSSGIYLYSVKATGNNGSKFQETRKMVLLK